MSELPDRPDLDQLRRQARELLRAAVDGEPRAITRLRAVSERVTLSAAQLAIAREHGSPSWPALAAEIQRRRLWSESASQPLLDDNMHGQSAASEDRWSFGGGAAIETSAGLLSPEALVVGAGHSVLDASLVPSMNDEPATAKPRRPLIPGMPFARLARGRARANRRAHRRRADAAVATMRSLTGSDDVAVIDDREARYALLPVAMSHKLRSSGEQARPMYVQLRLEPAPARGVKWLELRTHTGAATRLLPSGRPAVRIGLPVPIATTRPERELSDEAFGLIELQLTSAGEEGILLPRCSAALGKVAEIQRSGELDPASELPDQLRQLCAVLTEQQSADGLPVNWSGMLDAARRADGPGHHLDICAVLPPIDGVGVQVDTLVSMSESWRLYLRATPRWWNYSEDGRRKWNPVSVQAEDDRGGTYVSVFGGSSGNRDHDDLALRFIPRLDPRARALKLTWRGATDEVDLDLGLAPGAAP
jgi:hypothetical protein